VNNYYFNNKPQIDVYEKPKKGSNISSQILFGEKFKIINKNKKYFKVQLNYDKYVGFILKKNFFKSYKPTHKVKVLKSLIYKKGNLLSATKKYLSFSSSLQILDKNKNFYKFAPSMWLKKKDVCKSNKTSKNFKRIFKLFEGCKYKWGGKSFNGIDCSGLIQIYFKFNNKFFPRDTIDQIKFKKGTDRKSKFKSGDLIYWNGHVAACINNKKLIHAYGPMKKVVVMHIDETIKIIKLTAALKIKKIYSI